MEIKTKFLRRIFMVILSILAITILLISATADAATSSASIRVHPGTLSMSAPASIDLGDVATATTEQTVESLLSDIIVTDLRGLRNPPGWSATLTSTKFSEASDPSLALPFSQMSLAVPSPSQLPPGQSYFRVLSGDSTGITRLSTEQRFADSNGDGNSDPIGLMSASATHGAGQYSISVLLRLLVPAFMPSGSYSAVLTETVS